jgi:histidyl-tRNA synthetase
MIPTLPGFRVFAPEACFVRNHLAEHLSRTARTFGFEEYYTPVLEPLELFTEKSGPGIVKQLFAFQDQGGRSVALRPEVTPSLARLIQSFGGQLKKPIKWFTWGENFRYERPQRGRLRSFYQFNADILGQDGVQVDAELLALLACCFRSVGLGPEQVCIRLSDRRVWGLWLAAYGLDGQQAEAVLQVIDRLSSAPVEAEQALLEPFLKSETQDFWQDFWTWVTLRRFEDCIEFVHQHERFQNAAPLLACLEEGQTLMDHLAALGVADWVEVHFGIVRGLAYYTGRVFEAFERSGQGRALAGGGRYDDLVQKLGGAPMPAAGFAIGDVTLTDLLAQTQKLPAYHPAPTVWVVMPQSPSTLPAGLACVSHLRSKGLVADYSLKGGNLSKQLKLAYERQATWAAICGEQEVAQGQVQWLHLATKATRYLPVGQLPDGL